MLEQLRLIMQALPWTGPSVVVGAVLGFISMFVFTRRRTHADRLGFALLLWCLTLALVVTLSPVKNYYFGHPSSGCDWSIWQPLARQYWFSAGSRPPNVWLLLPAGVGVMMLDGLWRKFIGVVCLVVLPPCIETLQSLYPELKRSCSSQDVIDNWTGLLFGLAVGLVLAVLIGIFRWIRDSLRRRKGVLDDDRHRMFEADPELPLGGGDPASGGPYDEFADFDDTPRSTVWYEDGGADADSTQVMRAGQRLEAPRPYLGEGYRAPAGYYDGGDMVRSEPGLDGSSPEVMPRRPPGR